MRVLFVCDQDICRGPMAVAFLQSFFINEQLEARSVGLQAIQGAALHPLVQTILESRGLLLTPHRAQRLDNQSLAWADLILTMTRSQKFASIHLSPMIADKIYTFNAYLGNPIHDISVPPVEEIEAYRDCAFEIEFACSLLYQAIQDEASSDGNN